MQIVDTYTFEVKIVYSKNIVSLTCEALTIVINDFMKKKPKFIGSELCSYVITYLS